MNVKKKICKTIRISVGSNDENIKEQELEDALIKKLLDMEVDFNTCTFKRMHIEEVKDAE